MVGDGIHEGCKLGLQGLNRAGLVLVGNVSVLWLLPLGLCVVIIPLRGILLLGMRLRLLFPLLLLIIISPGIFLR